MAHKPTDEAKVMDVSKPGKGKIVTNSRPIAAPVVGNQAESDDVKPVDPEAEPTISEIAARLTGSSANRKVIQPVSMDVSDEKGEVVEIKNDSNKSTEENPADQPDDIPEIAKQQPEKKAEDSSREPESTDNLPTPKSDPNNPIAPAADDSGAASVDEMAKAAEQKRLEAEKAKETALRNQKVEELIRSKQYFVPIGHRAKTGRAKRRLIGLLAVVIILAGTYLALDTKLIGNNIKLPFEIIKETEATSTNAQPAAQKTEAKDKEDAGTVTPIVNKAEDDERKSELKNLQTKLESYYLNNDKYPTLLSELKPTLTENETTGASSDAYVYTPSADGKSFILTARLSDGTNYTLASVGE